MHNKTYSVTKELITSEWKLLQDNSESAQRERLATLYHIIYYNGWSDAIFTHSSLRLSNEDSYLFNPFGLMFNEITSDNLVKVMFNGDIESPCGYPINRNGSVIHTAIYKARPDVNCIIHTHSPNGVAFSNSKCELIGLDQTTMFLTNNVGYHEFNTLFTMDDKQEQLIMDLDNKNCMILRNHGLLAVGPSVPMAFWNNYYLEHACASQLKLVSQGIEINNPDFNIKEEVTKQYMHWHKSEDEYPGNADLLFLAEKRRLIKDRHIF